MGIPFHGTRRQVEGGDAKPRGWLGEVTVCRSPDASGVAQVVGNDHGGVQGLEVQDCHRVRVELGLWLHDQWQGLHGRLGGDLHHNH